MKIFLSGLFMAVILTVLLSGCGGGNATTTTTPDVTAGRVAYYTFDGDVADHSGTGDATKDGTVHGNATGAADRFGAANYAFAFPDATSYISVSHQAFITDPQRLTVSMWFKTDDTTFNSYFIGSNDFNIWYRGSGTTPTLRLVIRAYNSATSSDSLNYAWGACEKGSWVHFVGTYDGSNIKVYINGVLKSTTNHPGIIRGTSRGLTIGTFSDSGDPVLNCTIDDFRIYDRVLSDSEITQLYNYHN